MAIEDHVDLVPEAGGEAGPTQAVVQTGIGPTTNLTPQTEDMMLNLGPQHPSTHGVLRLEIVTDGEIVKDVIPHMGYLHRCYEKHAEKLPYNQVIPFVDRMDYMAAMNSEHAYAMGVERMLGIDKDP